MIPIEDNCRNIGIDLDTAYMVNVNWFTPDLYNDELHTHVKETIMPRIVVITCFDELPVTFLCDEEMLLCLKLICGEFFNVKYREWLSFHTGQIRNA